MPQTVQILTELRGLDLKNVAKVEEFLTHLEKYQESIISSFTTLQIVGADDLVPVVEEDLKSHIVKSDYEKLLKLDEVINATPTIDKGGSHYYYFVQFCALTGFILSEEASPELLHAFSSGLGKGIAHLEASMEKLTNPEEKSVFSNSINQLKTLKDEVDYEIRQEKPVKKEFMDRKLKSFYKIMETTRQELPKKNLETNPEKNLAIRFLEEAGRIVSRIVLGIINGIGNILMSHKSDSKKEHHRFYNKGRYTIILDSVVDKVRNEVEMQENVNPAKKV